MIYTYAENFMLPCHDEVVYSMKSLAERKKMPGDEWQMFAIRLLYSYMFTHPQRFKLLFFMGCEFR
jgi:1,4-alpha-glucan branching enzyme